METASEVSVFGVLLDLPGWLQERLSQVERLEGRGNALSPSEPKAVWHQLSMDGVALLEGGAVIRAVVLGADPASFEGVAIVLIEGGAVDRIVVRGNSIQGVHFEEAAYAALAEYLNYLPKARTVPISCTLSQPRASTPTAVAASAAEVADLVPLALGDSPVDASIRAAMSAGVVLNSVDADEIRTAMAKCDDLTRRATRLLRLASDPMRKGSAFPMGVGFTKMTKRASQRIDASVRRAGEASEVLRRADSARRYAEGLLAGENTFAARQRATAAQEELQRRVVGELLRWAKGRSILKLGVLRVNRDRAGYPVSFTVSGGNVSAGFGDKVDVVRAFFRGNKEAFCTLVDQLRGSELAGVGQT